MNAIAPTGKAWAERINAAWQSSVDGILETGRLIIAAKDALEHGAFTEMVKQMLPFGPRTAQRLMAVGADTRLANPTHVSHLPASWGTLYELTKLTDDQFDAQFKAGKIRPDIERREVINGARSVMGSRQEPDDSLDYFPTPPWATRALVEHVLPLLNVETAHPQSFWEPACGEGHISGVLAEYADTVFASDVFDYGVPGQTVSDFLKAEGEEADWIITNPPFGEVTEQFVLKALPIARVGVAMFVRLQWLETVGRYETVFRDNPPTLIAFFAERVNLCKGRWDPDGSTATAYIWLVWIKDEPPRAPYWIPPGCRERLSRPSDRDRFTAHPVGPLVERGFILPRHDPRTGEILDGEAEASVDGADHHIPRADHPDREPQGEEAGASPEVESAGGSHVDDGAHNGVATLNGHSDPSPASNVVGLPQERPAFTEEKDDLGIPDSLLRVELTPRQATMLARIDIEDCDVDERSHILRMRGNIAAITKADVDDLIALAKAQGLDQVV